MEKNILKSLFLLMVITGSIFAFVGCTPDEIALYEQKMKEQESQAVEAKPVERKITKNVEQEKVQGLVKKTEGGEGKNYRNEDRENEDGEDDEGEHSSTSTVIPAKPVVITPAPVVAPVVKPVPPSVPNVSVTTKYKDGTYTKVGSYQSPGGTDSITVTVTVKNDVVESVSLVNGAISGTSQYYENLFIDGVSAQVVGKKLDSVSVGKVNGASLTGNGFNNAVAQIRTTAQK
ncbi:MAG: hypothetical protein NTZ25_02650 [Candidatus Peregrinibacteria bacterium]|nr:hypothetical protein [Candidatus Peregrinibacteria bacterium]